MSTKASEIKFNVQLDKNNVPEKIDWDATDKPDDSPSDTRAIMISLWDHNLVNTMRMDLWTKEMTVDEMKRFYVDSIGGMAQSLMDATGDEFMSKEMHSLCNKLVKHIEEEMKGKQG